MYDYWGNYYFCQGCEVEVRLNMCSVCVSAQISLPSYWQRRCVSVCVRVIEQQQHHPQKWWSLNCSFHQNLDICIKDWFVWWLSSAEWEIHNVCVCVRCLVFIFSLFFPQKIVCVFSGTRWLFLFRFCDLMKWLRKRGFYVVWNEDFAGFVYEMFWNLDSFD